jgi:hypothetical protein
MLRELSAQGECIDDFHFYLGHTMQIAIGDSSQQKRGIEASFSS